MNHADQQLLASRVRQLLQHLSSGVYERGQAFRLCLLAALTGESVFLLGPPGIGKSLIAKRIIHAFRDGHSFEYLMTRFSTPEEVFGPLSIQALKEEGKYVRLTEGYLPDSNIVFLDEIWKAGPAILNTLLTVINEKVYRNGNQQFKVPMRLLITASNELPDEDNSLDALYDRMLLRVYMTKVQEKHNFKAMLDHEVDTYADPIPTNLKITDEEYHTWQAELAKVTLPEESFEKIYSLKTMLEELELSSEEEVQPAVDLYVSDRRWKKSIHLLRACAFYNGRQAISPTDLLILRHCLWRDEASRELVQQLLDEYAQLHAYDQRELQQRINTAHGQLLYLHQQITDSLALKFSHEPGLNGGRYRCYDLNRAQLFRFEEHGGLYKIILLEENQSISHQLSQTASWAYIHAVEFEKAIRKGNAIVHAYVNGNRKKVRILLALDGQLRLVAKDIGNRSVAVGVLGTELISDDDQRHWQQQYDALSHLITDIERQLRGKRDAFANTLPHNFVDTAQTDLIDASLLTLEDEMEMLREGFNQLSANMERIRQDFLSTVEG